MYCLESKISKQVLLTRELYCVPGIDAAELMRKLNAVNKHDSQGANASQTVQHFVAAAGIGL